MIDAPGIGDGGGAAIGVANNNYNHKNNYNNYDIYDRIWSINSQI